MNNDALSQHKFYDQCNKCQNLIIFNKNIVDKYGIILGVLSSLKTTISRKWLQSYYTDNFNSKLGDDVYSKLRNKCRVGEFFSELVVRLLNDLEEKEKATLKN
jgi:hypothetical protein